MFNVVKNFFRGGIAAAKLTMANWALDAARHDDAWGYTPWTLRTNDEVDEADRRTITQRARSLYYNSPPIRSAVEQIVRYIGVPKPLPTTSDEEWNKLALAAWHARTSNPHTFDVGGRVNFAQAISFCERRAIIDGDVIVVPTYAADGGAAFAFFCGPQIAGGGEQGVDVDTRGRATAYYLCADNGTVKKIPAWHAVLYQHQADPTRLRGRSLLAAALRNAKDLQTVVGHSKQGVKNAASMGLVVTKDNKPDGFNFGGSVAKARSPKGAPVSVDSDGTPKYEMGTALSLTYLPEGHDIKVISDTRPSQQLQTFFDFLIRSLAQAVSLDPEMLYTTNALSSAATRFALEKLHRFQKAMMVDQEVLANRIWRHFIACEIAAKRLRPCRDDAWANVRWIPERDMTIDTARIAQAHINLVNEGMADNEDYCLRTTGRTPAQLIERRARELVALHRIAKEYGLSPDELRPRQVGTVPTSTIEQETPPQVDDEPEMPSPDDDSEADRRKP